MPRIPKSLLRPDLIKFILMKKLLVPTDFSPNALRAVGYAVEIAKRNRAAIHLVHASDELLDNVFPSQATVTEEYNSTIITEAHESLSLLQKSIEETEGVLVNTEVYKGPIKESIRFAASEHDVDMVIMGTMGKSGLKEQIVGSKTAAVIGQCNKPVLAIPLEYEWSIPAKILLAIRDYSEARHLLEPVLELAGIFNADLQLALFTDVDKTTAFGYKQDEDALELVEMKIKKEHPELHARAVHLSGSDFLETLNDYIHENGIDMVCMLTHPRNAIQNLFHRSLTKKMAYQSKVPLLAIPVNEPA